MKAQVRKRHPPPHARAYHRSMPHPTPPAKPHATLDGEACYRALCAHDARFDGHFFTGVLSTGIYCRPVCRVRPPRREHCRFFTLAAQAEQAGFRPCLRCRPELAPGHSPPWSTTDAVETLTVQAMALLDNPLPWIDCEGGPVAAVAQRLGVTERHLRRLFAQRLGLSPHRYLQTRRLLLAKQWLTDTHLPLSEVAAQSGFGSLRRLHESLRLAYGLTPGQIRRQPASTSHGATLRLAYRPPYDVNRMMDFLRARAVPGLETVTDEGEASRWSRTLRLGHAQGCLSIRFEPLRHEVHVELDDGLLNELPALRTRLRAALDLDADPQAVAAVLGEGLPGVVRAEGAPSWAGVRLPGGFDGFEVAVRTVLAQQITLRQAVRLTAQLVRVFGEPMPGGRTGLERLFPTPQALATANPDVLGRLGILRTRQAALQALARAVLAGELSLQPETDPTSPVSDGRLEATLATLRRLPGVGEWTVQMIALRALRWPDALPLQDAALRRALGLTRHDPAQAVTERTLSWRPWRAYGLLRAWCHGEEGGQALR